jgi:hypothetical protein
MKTRVAMRRLILIAAIGQIALGAKLVRAQDVSLEVRSKDGRREYFLGEPIPLQMVFTSGNKQYIVDTSFRYPTLQGVRDDFLIDPKDGSIDPMEDYHTAMSRIGMSSFGGLRGIAPLGNDPVVLDLYLNDYVRFSKPGQYVLTLRDRRVSTARRSGNEPSQVVELISKPLTLTVLPADVEWQKLQLDSALEALRKGPDVNVNGCRTLTSLGTVA